MSKGTTRHTFRIEDDIWAEAENALRERNDKTPDEIWTISQWVRIAIVEKLDKIRRGRKMRGGVRHPPPRRVN